MPPTEVPPEVATVYDEVRTHHDWFSRNLPMIASENCISPLARALLVSDFHDRYAEGRPGKRYYQGLVHIDRVEELCEDLAQQLFDCRYSDNRPISGTVANMGVYFALAKPGDTFAAAGTSGGAHISHARFGGAGLRGLEIVHLPTDESRMTVDAEGAAEVIRDEAPRLIVLGQSVFLFPAPVEELAPVAKEVGAHIWYDGAHVLGLIAGGRFQDPLHEGADVMTASTHKTLPGPQGGVVLSDRDPDDEEDAAFLKKLDSGVFPGVVSNHHLHHLAAKAIAYREHIEFGQRYADTVVRSSQALAQALHERGFVVPCEEAGFTESHQVLVDVRDHDGGKVQAQRLEDAGIICNMNMLPGDSKPMNPSGLRLGTQELVRVGMGPNDMEAVAELYARVVLKGEDPDKVATDTAALRSEFDTVEYCFGPEVAPHGFFELFEDLP